VDEWAKQIRRWIVGASESFHYLLIHWRFSPLLSGLRWSFLFFVYYAVLLCCAGVFQICAAVPLPWLVYDNVTLPGDLSFNLQYAGVVSVGLQYVVFGIAFAIDAAAVRYMGIRERIHPCRNLLHWLSAPAVLLAYSLIAFQAIVVFVFVGKKMAGHDMAAKEGMKHIEGATDAAAAAAMQELLGGAAVKDAGPETQRECGKTYGSVAVGANLMLYTMPPSFSFGAFADDPLRQRSGSVAGAQYV
jgi:hypothetical protein